jgi:hypothetical protein
MWFFGIFKFFWYQWTSLYERKCESTEGFEWRMMGAYGEREVFKELFCEASAPAKSSFARQHPALSCEPLSLFSLSLVTSLPLVCSRMRFLFVCLLSIWSTSFHSRVSLGWLSLCWCTGRQFTLDGFITLVYFVHSITR